MDCKECREILSEYIDGRLTVEDSAAVAAHLETCSECRTLDDQLRATIELVGSLDLKAAPGGFAEAVTAALERRMLLDGQGKKPRYRFAPWKLGAVGLAAAAAIVVAVVVYHMPVQPPSPAESKEPIRVAAAPSEDVSAEGSAGASLQPTLASRASSDAYSMREGAAGGIVRGVDSFEGSADTSTALSWKSRETEEDAGPTTGAEPVSLGEKVHFVEDKGTAGEAVAKMTIAVEAPSETAERLRAAGDLDGSAEQRGGAEVGTAGVLAVQDGIAGRDIADAPAETAVPVETLAEAAKKEAAQEQAVAKIEFTSEQGALEATALFANNFLAVDSQIKPVVKPSPEALRKALGELNMDVLELNDERTVIQGRFRPAVVVSNNIKIAQFKGLSQQGPTPEFITSQVVSEPSSKSDGGPWKPTTHILAGQQLATGGPLVVQYIFIRQAPPAAAKPADLAQPQASPAPAAPVEKPAH